jgi:Fic family protein
MAYIDSVRSGSKTYYYLGKTVRIGPDKWKKVRIRLGTEKPSKETVAEKLKELKLEQYSVFNEEYLSADKLEFIDDFKEVCARHAKMVPKTVLAQEEEDFLIRFTYNSNAIEGNKLTLRDTYLIMKEKQIPTGAPPKDFMEALNGQEAFEFVKSYKGRLDVGFIERINGILTKNTGVEHPGVLRFFPVRILGAEFVPPPAEKVPEMLRDLIAFYYANRRRYHPFVMALLFHGAFVEIHPFEDGNGRTARTLLNWILMKAGYPRLYVPVKQRIKYYAAIDCHNEKRFKDYCNLMFEVMVDQMRESGSGQENGKGTPKGGIVHKSKK